MTTKASILLALGVNGSHWDIFLSLRETLSWVNYSFFIQPWLRYLFTNKTRGGGFATDRSGSPSAIRWRVRPIEMVYCPAWKHGVSSFVGLYSSKTNDVQNVCLRALWDHSWAAAHWCVSHANVMVFQSICHPITLTSLCTGACRRRWKEQNHSCLILKQIVWGTFLSLSLSLFFPVGNGWPIILQGSRYADE